MSDTKFLPSRSGAVFMARVEVETDGALTILTNSGHGERSAHRDAAREHFGTGNLWCMNRLSWINTDNARVTLTRWHTQAFRKG